MRAHDGLVCTSCGYALAGLDTSGECPECGSEFDAAEVRRIWKESLND